MPPRCEASALPSASTVPMKNVSAADNACRCRASRDTERRAGPGRPGWNSVIARREMYFGQFEYTWSVVIRIPAAVGSAVPFTRIRRRRCGCSAINPTLRSPRNGSAKGSSGTGCASTDTVRESSACANPGSPMIWPAQIRPASSAAARTTIGCSARNAAAAPGISGLMMRPTRPALSAWPMRRCTASSPA